jgi:hypothetical protein
LANWNVTGVLAGEIDYVWPTVEPILQRALDRSRGEYLSEDIYGYIKRREMQLWVAVNDGEIKAVCLTEIVSFPRLKVCRLVIAAGEGMRHWVKLGSETLKAWAKAQGCQEIRGGGRVGWARALGWKPIYSMCGERI